MASNEIYKIRELAEDEDDQNTNEDGTYFILVCISLYALVDVLPFLQYHEHVHCRERQNKERYCYYDYSRYK